jgi:hypothetical protein
LENDDDQSGATGGTDSDSYDAAPGAPGDDDTPAGDTDQHTDAPPSTWQGGR